MKYKCQVCGQIIDNNEMCPFCGSDGSQIVPLDNQLKKGHYRCLVCGRETDNGDFCPYCGSQRLYNLDTQKKEDTASLDIISDLNVTSSLDVSQENQEEKMHEVEEEIEEAKEPVKEQSLEERYFAMFGELLPLESISSPDPEKVNALYRMGINRGEKITPLEIANTFAEEEAEDDESPVAETAVFRGDSNAIKPEQKNVEKIVEVSQVAKPVENVPVAHEINDNDNAVVLLNVDLLLGNDLDEISSTILMDIRDEIINGTKKDLDRTKKDLLETLEKVAHEKKSEKLQKDLELLRVLFKD